MVNMVNYVSTYIKGTLNKRSAKDLSNDAYAMFLWVCFSEFLYKSICCGYSFELHWQVDAIQMGTHNICFYKEVDKKYTGVNLKTTELLDCTRIGVCAVIRSNTVCAFRYLHGENIQCRVITSICWLTDTGQSVCACMCAWMCADACVGSWIRLISRKELGFCRLILEGWIVSRQVAN